MSHCPSASIPIRENKAAVSVVIPIYNEQDNLENLRMALTQALADWSGPVEIVAVDDGSEDGSWEQLKQIQVQDSRWNIIRLARNFGHQAAIWTGLRAATGQVVGILDADLQDPPGVLRTMLEEWCRGADVAFGIRQARKEGVFLHSCYNLFYRVLSRLSAVPLPRDAGDFCVMDRAVLQAMLRTHEADPFVRGLRAWAGFRQVGVPYSRSARHAGASHYSFQKLGRLAFSGIFSFSTAPLRLATCFGFCVSGLALLGSVFTLLQRIFHEQFAKIGLAPVPGFATIVISILFIGGVQLICIGILGEYLARVYETVKGRPVAVIAEQHGGKGREPCG